MRPMSDDMATALSSPLLRPAIFFQAQFASGTIYLWSGIGTISWNGQNWTGVGSLGKISAIEEGTGIEAKGVTVQLSGIDPAMLADALQELQLGTPAAIYLALFDTSSPPQLIADPLVCWAGRVDQPTIEVSGESATISLNCENRLLDMNVAVDRRYTLDDSHIENPDDLGFMFVNSLQEQTISWGRTPASSNNL